MGSLGAIQAQRNENKRKALNIALGAVTGGVGGAVTAAAKEAGVNSKAVGQLTNTRTDVLGDTPVQSSPQEIAAQTALTSADNAIQAKQAQKERWAKHIEAYNRGDYSKLSPQRQKAIKAGIEKYQRENNNGTK